jgi:hypothetical protein
MCRVNSYSFNWRLNFLIKLIVLAACLQKTGGFAPLAHAKFACDWRRVAYNLYPIGCQSHANCTLVAASHMQIVSTWPPVTFNMNTINWSPHPRHMLPTIQLTALRYLVWKMCLYYGWHSHMKENFARVSGQLCSNPPVFCNQAARTINLIKKLRRHLKL